MPGKTMGGMGSPREVTEKGVNSRVTGQLLFGQGVPPFPWEVKSSQVRSRKSHITVQPECRNAMLTKQISRITGSTPHTDNSCRGTSGYDEQLSLTYPLGKWTPAVPTN